MLDNWHSLRKQSVDLGKKPNMVLSTPVLQEHEFSDRWKVIDSFGDMTAQLTEIRVLKLHVFVKTGNRSGIPPGPRETSK